MDAFYKMVTFEHESEHVLEHDLSNQKNYSKPKIYTANGNLSKRWYVYFSFRNPKTGKLERIKNIYGKANQFQTKEDRLAVLSAYRKNLLEILKEGYSPFTDNATLHKSKKEPIGPVVDTSNEALKISTETSRPKEEVNSQKSLKEALDFVLNLKGSQVNERTLQDYGYKVNAFIDWTAEHHPEIRTIDQLNKKTVSLSSL